MFNDADNKRFLEKVSPEEIKRVLKYFAADKIMGPDG